MTKTLRNTKRPRNTTTLHTTRTSRLAIAVFVLMWPLTFALLGAEPLYAQDADRAKVFLITMDGFRWQELFAGADSNLIAHPEYVSDTTALKEAYWRATPEARRQALMPFVWDTVSRIGQIHGNRSRGSKVNMTNGMLFSYPGYNEILTGRADDERIDSNEKRPNPNVTILEKINAIPAYAGRVAAFASWDVFPYIINEVRSGIPVNAGFEAAQGNDLTEIERFLNRVQPHTPSPWGSVRLDMFTHNYALEYIKRNQPDVVYIAYGETDDFAHDGDYDAYLDAAHRTDAFLRELWEYAQSTPYYMDKTTFILTTDHGRGTEPLDDWRNHGADIEGADEVWLMMYGAGVEALGEVTEDEQVLVPAICERISAITGADSCTNLN